MKKLLIILFISFLLIPHTHAQTGQSEREVEIQNIRQGHLRAREGFTARKEAYRRTTERVEGTREDFLKIRERFVDTKDPEVRQDYLDIAQTHLLQLLDSMTSHVLRLKSKIENSDTLDSDFRRKLLESLDNRLSKIGEFKSETRNLTDPDGFRDLAQQIKSHWQEIRETMSLVGTQFMLERIENYLNSLQTAANNIEDKIVELQNLGHDTESIESQLETLGTSITDSNSSFLSASKTIDEPQGVTDGDETTQNPLEMLQEVHSELRTGQQILNEIIHSIKILLGEQEPMLEAILDETESEVIDSE